MAVLQFKESFFRVLEEDGPLDAYVGWTSLGDALSVIESLIQRIQAHDSASFARRHAHLDSEERWLCGDREMYGYMVERVDAFIPRLRAAADGLRSKIVALAVGSEAVEPTTHTPASAQSEKAR